MTKLIQTDPSKRLKFFQIKFHPWGRETCVYGLDLFSYNNIQSHNKLNDDVFYHLLKLKIDFHQMSEEKMKDAAARITTSDFSGRMK